MGKLRVCMPEKIHPLIIPHGNNKQTINRQSFRESYMSRIRTTSVNETGASSHVASWLWTIPVRYGCSGSAYQTSYVVTFSRIHRDNVGVICELGDEPRTGV